MYNSFKPVMVIALIGVFLVAVKYRHAVFIFLRDLLCQQNLEGKVVLETPSPVSPLRALFERVVDYFLAICVTFIGFYSAYLLGIQKINNENRDRTVNLLVFGKKRCDEIESVLCNYASIYTPQNNITPRSDSTIITDYYRSSVRQPFYLTGSIPPEKILLYLTLTGYNVLGTLEQNEQAALAFVHDTTISFRERHKALNAAIKFDSLRSILIQGEKNRALKEIDSCDLVRVEDSVNSVNSGFTGTLYPKAYFNYYETNGHLSFYHCADSSNIGFGYTHDDNEDSLRKYSYLVVRKSKVGTMNTSACFFIRKNGSLYLVTTYSIFTSWNTTDTTKRGGRSLLFADTLEVRLTRKANQQIIFVPFPVSKIAQGSRFRHFWDKPDVFIYKITDTTLQKTFNIYSVENLIGDYNISNGTPLDVFVAGFPGSPMDLDRSYYKVLPTLSKGKLRDPISYRPRYDNIKRIDSLNYMLDFCPPPGMWGSPVFFNVTVPNGSTNINLITFGGIYFATDVDKRWGRVVRPEEIIKIMEKL